MSIINLLEILYPCLYIYVKRLETLKVELEVIEPSIKNFNTQKHSDANFFCYIFIDEM